MAGDQRRHARRVGVFTGPPLYVWISNQLGNTGVLQGSLLEDNPTNRPFNPDVNKYKPTNVTGAPAASYELDVTDNKFKFPQVLRNNIAVDRRLPGGITGTAEFYTTMTSTASTTSTLTCRRRSPRSRESMRGRDGLGTACAAPRLARVSRESTTRLAIR